MSRIKSKTLRQKDLENSISLSELYYAGIIKTNLTDKFYCLNRYLHKLKNDHKKNDNKLNFQLSYATCNIYASINRIVLSLEWIDISITDTLQKMTEALFTLVLFDETHYLVLDIQVIDKLIELLIDFEDFLTIFYTKFYADKIKEIGIIRDSTGKLKLNIKEDSCCFS